MVHAMKEYEFVTDQVERLYQLPELKRLHAVYVRLEQCPIPESEDWMAPMVPLPKYYILGSSVAFNHVPSERVRVKVKYE